MGSESTSNQPDTTADATGASLGSFDGDTVLIAYDGSEEANGAIDYAGRFLSAKNAYILTVWEPIHRQAARTAGMSGMMQHDWSSLGDDTEDPAYTDAVEICREGVALAESHGFVTEPFLVESATAVWSAIVDASRELDVLDHRRRLTGIERVAFPAAVQRLGQPDQAFRVSGPDRPAGG